MNEKIAQRLKSFGYIVTTEDTWVIDFLIQKVENYIKNECNVDTVPEGLIETQIDMVCGEFLLMKKQTNSLGDMDVSEAIKTIAEGDTTITFQSGMTIDSFITYLMEKGKGDFSCYRKLKW